MKIAQISPLYEAVPPKFYGGTERIVAHLSDALVGLGHDVTLFASGDSTGTRATLAPMRPQAIRLDPAPLKSDLAAHLSMMHDIRLRAHEFDVLHFHTDMLHFPIFNDMAGRTLTTLHGRLDMSDLAGAYARWHDFPLVSISNSQRTPQPAANWLATVPHGMNETLYTPVAKPEGDYLAFLGRISPEKGPERAIEIAKRAGMKLRIAAKVDAADRQYHRDHIAPLLDHPLIEFIGEIGGQDKSDFLANAAALVFPIDWPEPFGLVMIEAMACGTPVIAWNNGSVPEVIEHDLTGIIVDSMDGAVAAVKQSMALDRARIRQRFEERFSARVMAQTYLDLYRRISSRGGDLAQVA